ncbi:clathrin heavy chain linker domain-containing protein 1-like [Asterias amurensis]|uniref:clathrin heavy chain linker domain-containing protein 1-like n=1 Tax=Asterias amurensis TaxID=7602 RepID=UPI003AB6EBA1
MQQQQQQAVSPKRPVLPPISSNVDKDHTFVKDLIESAFLELEKLDCPPEGPHQQRYSVFKDVFGQLVEYLSAYRPLLTSIKAEFEDCIQTIERGQQEAFFLSGKVKTMAAEQTTLSFYTKRADQLKQKISKIESDNERLNYEIQSIFKQHVNQITAMQEEDITPKVKIPSVPNRLLPGLTLEESIDIELLCKKLCSLEQLVKDLHLAKKTRYTSRDQKKQLKVQLASKSKAKDHVVEKNTQLKARCLKLRVSIDALRMYCKESPMGHTPVEAIIHALTRSNSKMSSRSGDTASSTFDDDDPSKEREAEMLLEYIEHFNDLFEDGQYIQAAMHAANSPKGILRNSETLTRFRAIHAKPGKTSPLLAYCEALMASVPAVASLPNAETSLECVKSALTENRLDLVMHWLAQKRLTCSEPLGHLLYNYTQGKNTVTVGQCLPLAEAVYTIVGAHIQAAVCMCKQGKVQAMMDYATNADFGKDMYIGVLLACPSLAVAEVLIEPRGLYQKSALSVGTVVNQILHTENHEIGVQLLHKLQQMIKSGSLTTSIKDVVLCDADTDYESWMQIIYKCQDNGLYDVGLELLAAVTVLQAIRKASETITK